MLIVADVTVADDEVPSDPVQSGVPGAGFSGGTVDVAVSAGRVEGGVRHKMIAEQPRGHRETGVVGVVAAVGGVQLHERVVGRSLGAKGDRTAERAVTVGRGTYTTLDLNTFHKCGIAVHVSPEDTLILRRVERHTVHGDIDSGIPGSPDT